MRKPWKIITTFALFGLLVAAASYAYAASDDYTKPMNGFRFAFWTSSMTSIPLHTLIDCEVIGTGGLIMYSIIGALNTALYAAVGAIFERLKSGPSSS